MGLFTNPNGVDDARDIEMNFNMAELLEAMFFDMHYSDSDEEKRELLENAEYFTEAKKISRKTIVRLNKNDDLTRRTGMAALQLAKDNNDPLWKKLVKNRIMERKLLAAIKKKYAGKANLAARKGQRLFVQTGGTKPVSQPKLQPNAMSKTRH